ncbi:MAG: hypothetical protein LBF70_00630 [Holosporales bacterium]|jgi:chromosome segregation ATPase|nr:hypothetical protein [Holosporales bacterium]
MTNKKSLSAFLSVIGIGASICSGGFDRNALLASEPEPQNTNQEVDPDASQQDINMADQTLPAYERERSSPRDDMKRPDQERLGKEDTDASSATPPQSSSENVKLLKRKLKQLNQEIKTCQEQRTEALKLAEEEGRKADEHQKQYLRHKTDHDKASESAIKIEKDEKVLMTRRSEYLNKLGEIDPGASMRERAVELAEQNRRNQAEIQQLRAENRQLQLRNQEDAERYAALEAENTRLKKELEDTRRQDRKDMQAEPQPESSRGDIYQNDFSPDTN